MLPWRSPSGDCSGEKGSRHNPPSATPGVTCYQLGSVCDVVSMPCLVSFDLDAARHGHRTGKMANAGFQYLSNLDRRPLQLAGLTIALPKPLVCENLAESFDDDRHHTHDRQNQKQPGQPGHRRSQE